MKPTRNVLIVDDHPTNRKLLRTMLEAEGFNILEASDGMEALVVLDQERIDAIISDILMPRMDGYRLCYELRKDPRFSHLPFIAYTATYTSTSDEKFSVEIGADRFIRKPAPSKVIIRELNEVIATGRRSTAGATTPIDEMALMKEYSERLVAKLEERNIELEQRIQLAALSAEVGAALAHKDTLREMLQRCSEALVQHLDAAFARIWTHNEREEVLELQASAGMYTHTDGPHGRVPMGKFKIGLIAQERKPHLTNSVIGDTRVPEQEWARREGLVAFAGYPLVIGDRVVGVVAMFARHPLPQATLEAMASIADAVALGIERKRAEEELRNINDQLNQLLANSPAVIYRLKIEGQNATPTFVSDNIQRLLGVTVAETRSFDWWLKSLHPEDRDRMLTTLANGLKEGGYTAEYRIQHRDGTYRWVLDNNSVVRGAAGEPQEVVGVWTDITERKLGEFELEQTHNQLLAVSRQAGMAEFATGVLHNVGNVLNSINVASTCMSDSLQRSKSANLLKVVALMSQHEADLGAFFMHDPKGKQVPGYLAQLAHHLAAEHATALKELSRLQNNVEHVKHIITVQQDSAKMSRSPEVFKLTDLLEETLNLNMNGIQRRGIQVIKEFEEIPPTLIEKHQVLQILVNLVRNAIQALDGSGSPEKRLTLRASQHAGRIRISVADNGSGIQPENLCRIFAHGFTTRKDGHGFGLHAAARAAKEMGGSLGVQSEGPGRGATFTLELPMKNQRDGDHELNP